jgi:uncharacterized protein YecE (DUF72 family)
MSAGTYRPGGEWALRRADRQGRPVTPLWRTADFAYLRPHEGRAHPWPRYGRQALKTWLGRLHGVPEAFVFFHNDPGGAAVTDPDALSRLAR